MSHERSHSTGFFILAIAVAAVLTAFLSGAGADEDTPDSSSSGRASELAGKPSDPINISSDDVTWSAKAEQQTSSALVVKVSYKREGESEARLFLIPRELASRMEGGLTGKLEVRSLVLASNGEPKQLIIFENREGKKVHEVEFQVGWNRAGSKTTCKLSVQASGEGKWGTPDEPRRDLGLPIEDADCRHYIFNPELHDSKHSS